MNKKEIIDMVIALFWTILIMLFILGGFSMFQLIHDQPATYFESIVFGLIVSVGLIMCLAGFLVVWFLVYEVLK